MKLRTLSVALFALLSIASIAQPSPQSTNTPKPFDDSLKTAILEAVSKRIEENAYVGGVDFSKWNKMIEKRKDAAMKANTPDQFALVINQAFSEFGFSHLNLMTPRAATTNFTGKSVGIGIQAQPEKEGVRVARVITGGPADKAGLKSGDLIVKADGKPALGPENIRGEVGTEVKLEIKREGKPNFEVTIKRAEFSVLVKDELKWIDEKTALISVNTFAVGYDRALIDELFVQAAKAETIIIDLRNNGGGSTINLFHLGGKIMKDGTTMGKFITKSNAKAFLSKYPDKKDDPIAVAKEFGIPISATARRNSTPYAGKVAVLINGNSASASEIFAASVQDAGRGKIIGIKTAGAVLASTYMALPEGWSLQLPMMEYVTPGGKRLEGGGVVPDVKIEAKDIMNNDVVLKAAIAAVSINK